MGFSENKLQQFSKKISSLRDQPNMQPSELKAYFDSSPEEVRQAHNGLCDALSAVSAAAALGFQRTAGVPVDTVQAAVENVQSQITDAVLGNIPSGSVNSDKLAQDVRDRFTSIENSVTGEAAARAGGDSNLQQQINALQTTITVKSEVICGHYDGDGAASRFISLGRTPRAVLVITQGGEIYDINTSMLMGGLALTDSPSVHRSYRVDTVTIVTNGFQVYVAGTGDRIYSNCRGLRYHYLALM